MTGHIIEARLSLHDDGETVLVSFRVVWLPRAPPVLGCGPAAGPGHTPGPVVDPPSSPEVGLTLPHQQAGQLPLLVRAVQGDGRHPVRPAVGGTFAGCEGGAAQPPGDQELLPAEGVVGLAVTTGSTSTSSTSDSLLGRATGSSTIASTKATDKVGQTSEETLRLNRDDTDQQQERNGCCWFHDCCQGQI